MKSGTPRRTFLGQLAIGTAGLAAARGVAAAPTPAAPATGPGTRPAGDLARRIDLTARRLTSTGVPAYTEDVVLADVTLDARRRFWNFSGDLSGRWVDALAALPPADRSPADIAPLVAKLLAQQRPDGRFGRTDLAFTAAETGTEHMALLWGNGRLLVGLMAYWQATRDAAVLAAARRLAAFLLTVREATKAPEVMARVEGQGAFGFICFTQLAEGLAHARRGRPATAVRGGRARDRPAPAAARRAALPRLPLDAARRRDPPRGRGRRRRCSRSRSGSTASSSARATTRSTAASWSTSAGATPRTRRRSPPRRAASGAFPRNEGCGLADFVRLSLQLAPSDGPGRVPGAGRALPRQRLRPQPVRERRLRLARLLRPGHPARPPASTARGGAAPCTATAPSATCSTTPSSRRTARSPSSSSRTSTSAGRRPASACGARRSALTCAVTSAFEGVLAVREPSWAENPSLSLTERRRLSRGRLPPSEGASRRATGSRRRLAPRLRLLTPKGEEIPLSALGSDPVRAALYCGPWLVVADEQIDPHLLRRALARATSSRSPATSPPVRRRRTLRLAVAYEHDGFRGRCPPSSARWARRRPTSRRRSPSGSTTAARDRGRQSRFSRWSAASTRNR